MEVAGIRIILERWLNDSKVVTIVHDKDSKISKAIRDSGWDVEQKIDANHACKSLRRCWTSLTKKEKDLLYGLKDRLENWLNFVLHQDLPVYEKEQLWMNAKSHSNWRNRIHLEEQIECCSSRTP
jgi:hypothetical protein